MTSHEEQVRTSTAMDASPTPTQAVTILRSLLLVIVLGGWCVIALRSDLSQLSLETLLRSRKALLLVSMLSALNFALRAFRWHWYLTRMGHSLRPLYSTLTYVAGFAFSLTPGKLGEVVRARYYRDAGIPVADVAGVLLLERLMDLLTALLLATLVPALLPELTALVRVAAFLGVGAVAVLIILSCRPFNLCVRTPPRVPEKLTLIVTHAIGTLRRVRLLLLPFSLLWGLFLGLAAWIPEGVGLSVLTSMTGLPAVAIPTALGIYAVSELVGALSFLPGGLGSIEAVMATLLVTQGYSTADAVLITLTYRMLTLWLAVGLGWIAVLLLRGWTRTFGT